MSGNEPPPTMSGELVPEEDLSVGTPVGEYRVERKLGEGAFGKVFKGKHPLIGKSVAIKVLSRKYSADPEVVSRFVSEARAVNEIAHRNIIDIFAFGQLEDGRHYYVMELLEGRPLDALVREKVMTVGEALPILRGLARALDAAHAKGIAHRDLKPANVFISEEPDAPPFPKLLDFGIAKLLSDEFQANHKTRTGAPLGTPYYMSPEQCRAEEVDHRTDIYSFGVLTFQLLTGALPFRGANYIEVLIRHMQDPPPLPSSANPALPTSIDDVILWMMAKDPGERPPNLVTAVEALAQAAKEAGLPVPEASLGGSSAPQLLTIPRPPSSGGVESAALNNPALADTYLQGREEPVRRPERRGLFLVGGLVGLALAAVAVVFASLRQEPDLSLRPEPPGETPGVVAPAPETPPAPEPTQEPEPPLPEPKTVRFSVEGKPEGAKVIGRKGEVLCTLPCELELDRSDKPLVLKFRADGYRPHRQEVTPSADGVISVALEKKRRASKRPSKDDIEEAF